MLSEDGKTYTDEDGTVVDIFTDEDAETLNPAE